MIELDRIIGSPFTWVIFNKTSNLDITFLGTERVGKGEGGKEIMSWDVIPSDNQNETETKGQILLVYIREELLELYRRNQNEVFSSYLQQQPQKPYKYTLNVEILKRQENQDDEEGFKIQPEVILPDENVENLDQSSNKQSQDESNRERDEQSKEDL